MVALEGGWGPVKTGLHAGNAYRLPDFPPRLKVLKKFGARVCMSRLELAQKRFLAALEAVENAAGSVGESLDGAAKGAERIAGLEAERERLLGRIAELEEEIATLSGLTEEVEGRLDGAIGEIRAALAR
jgi:chromosome segregation ATPase